MTKARKKSVSYYLGFFGALALFAGVFCPLVDAPVIGVLSYFSAGKIQAVIVIICVVIALYDTVKTRGKGLWLPVVGTVIAFTWTYFSLLSQVTHAKHKYLGKLGETFLGDMATGYVKRNIHLHWGMTVLCGGLALVVVAAILSGRGRAGK
jgi:hypothetical protein